MKLAIIFNKNKFAGKLTKFWTGCYAYHCGWVDEENGLFYDMHLIRRRRHWPHYSSGDIILFDFPQVTKEYLEDSLSIDVSTYGWKDYILFSLRPIFHLFGKSTPNVNGVICSEMVNVDLRLCGVNTPWRTDGEVPSPCDLYEWATIRTALI